MSLKEKNKYKRQIKEYNDELKRHEQYKKELDDLLIKKTKSVPIGQMSRYVYLTKKIRNTDPLRRFRKTPGQIRLAKLQEEKNKQKEILKAQQLAEKELEENRYEILSDSDDN